MDTDAPRRARQKAWKTDLAEAYTEEEACPPEWTDLLVKVDEGRADVQRRVESECSAFSTEPDIRRRVADLNERSAGSISLRRWRASTGRSWTPTSSCGRFIA